MTESREVAVHALNVLQRALSSPYPQVHPCLQNTTATLCAQQATRCAGAEPWLDEPANKPTVTRASPPQSTAHRALACPHSSFHARTHALCMRAHERMHTLTRARVAFQSRAALHPQCAGCNDVGLAGAACGGVEALLRADLVSARRRHRYQQRHAGAAAAPAKAQTKGLVDEGRMACLLQNTGMGGKTNKKKKKSARDARDGGSVGMAGELGRGRGDEGVHAAVAHVPAPLAHARFQAPTLVATKARSCMLQNTGNVDMGGLGLSVGSSG